MVQSRDSSAEVLGWAPRSVYGLSDFWALKNRCVHVFWEKTYKDVFLVFFFPPYHIKGTMTSPNAKSLA